MTDAENITLKAACVQAAATLMAGRDHGTARAANVTECTRLARELFEEITGTPWPKP
jgi:hypothetical protein